MWSSRSSRQVSQNPFNEIFQFENIQAFPKAIIKAEERMARFYVELRLNVDVTWSRLVGLRLKNHTIYPPESILQN